MAVSLTPAGSASGKSEKSKSRSDSKAHDKQHGNPMNPRYLFPQKVHPQHANTTVYPHQVIKFYPPLVNPISGKIDFSTVVNYSENDKWVKQWLE